jgi:hypothetical protein
VLRAVSDTGLSPKSQGKGLHGEVTREWVVSLGNRDRTWSLKFRDGGWDG